MKCPTQSRSTHATIAQAITLCALCLLGQSKAATSNSSASVALRSINVTLASTNPQLQANPSIVYSNHPQGFDKSVSTNVNDDTTSEYYVLQQYAPLTQIDLQLSAQTNGSSAHASVLGWTSIESASFSVSGSASNPLSALATDRTWYQASAEFNQFGRENFQLSPWTILTVSATVDLTTFASGADLPFPKTGTASAGAQLVLSANNAYVQGATLSAYSTPIWNGGAWSDALTQYSDHRLSLTYINDSPNQFNGLLRIGLYIYGETALASPVPEPSTISMAVAGTFALALGVAARRRV